MPCGEDYFLSEKEKNEKVSGKFLYAVTDFSIFKKDEAYWLEYIGNDTYVGRSDNILNQKFHITPRQLYTLFSQQLEEVQGPSQKEKQVLLNYKPPFDKNPSGEQIIDALIHHLNEQDGLLTAINCVSTKAILSWLKKQKEQKPLPPASSGARYYFDEWIKQQPILKYWDAFLAGIDFNKKEQKATEWNPTNEDVILFNKAITTNAALTPDERAKLDIIRMKFKRRPVIKQEEQKPANEQFPPLEGLDAIKAKYYDDGFKNGFDEGATSVKPAEWSEKDKEMLGRCIVAIPAQGDEIMPTYYLDKLKNWIQVLPERFNLQSEQKWSEDYNEENIQTRFAFYTYKDDPSTLYLSNVFVEETSRNHGFGTRILRAAEKVAEAIGATTISLKVKQDSPANAWYRKNGYKYVAFEDGYDWLKKNLEYMNPNKQEWSEEDKDYYDTIVSKLEIIGDDSGLSNNQIKFLREHCPSHCSNEWSQDDQKMLGDIIRYLEVQKEDRDAPFFDLAISFLKSLRPQSHKWYIKKGHWYMCIVDKPEYGWTKGKVYQSPEDNRIETNYKGSLTNWPDSEPWFRPATHSEIPDNQPHWKPSEEELVALKCAGSTLRDCGHSELAKMVFMIEGKLANLSIIDKSIWKPNEEQMKHLEKCFSHGHTVGLPNQHVLESLYNDLKKLM